MADQDLKDVPLTDDQVAALAAPAPEAPKPSVHELVGKMVSARSSMERQEIGEQIKKLAPPDVLPEIKPLAVDVSFAPGSFVRLKGQNFVGTVLKVEGTHTFVQWGHEAPFASQVKEWAHEHNSLESADPK